MKIPKPNDTGDYNLNKFLGFVWKVLSSPLLLKNITKAADYTVEKSDSYIGITDTSSARTITLPALASIEDGQVIIVKDQSGACAVNNITVEGYLAETIDGAANYVLNTNYAALMVMKMPTGWFSL